MATLFGTSGVDIFVNQFTTFQFKTDGSGGPIISGPFSPDIVLSTGGGVFGVGATPTFVTFVTTFADIPPINYGFSPVGVSIDLEANIAGQTLGLIAARQHLGFAEGDVLVDVSFVTGSAFNDVIRGSDSYHDLVSAFDLQHFSGFTGILSIVNDPGDNILNGGSGNDTLEGRGGADILDGGPDFDTASYESSPAAVTVRLPGLGADTTLGIASSGDATGDSLLSIEGLVGSVFADQLTGNSRDNVLAGGLGNDVLDGRGGNDTADYSRDHFFGVSGIDDSADKVVVQLGLNNAHGTGTEFKAVPDLHTQTFSFVRESVDTLISIENVTGTEGGDTITGNEQANILSGRGGADTLDGGFGDDVLIGGPGSDTASYVSHDASIVTFGSSFTISLSDSDSIAGSATATAFVNLTHQFQVVESDQLFSIENVIGSNHSETINGNSQANTLDGRGGDDILNGGAGDDTYVVIGRNGGNDRFFDVSGAADKVLISSFLDIFDSEQDGNDLVVTTGSGSFRVVDHFNGHPIETIVDSGTGESMVLATGLVGGLQPGIISGSNADETLDGRGGDDFLFGNGGKDTLLGGTGNDHLDGGKGDDILDGGSGNDTLTGGKGHDTFVFAPMTHNTPGSGNDVVTDFVHGQDRLDLRAFDTSFRALQTEDGHAEHGQGHHPEDDDRITMHLDGHDTVLEFDGGSVRITGITQLHADDFFFEKSSSSFTGTVAGLSGQDAIDFVDTGFGANSTLGSSGNLENSGGTLSVGDGVHMANIALLGSYMASSFAAASGGQGGTLISEAAQASTQTPIVTQPHA